MALQPVLTLTELAPDASYLIVKDNTGVYNAQSNPGGFGTPNPASADVTAAIFHLSSFTDITKSFGYRVGTFSSFLASQMKATVGTFMGISDRDVFRDGVYSMKYYLAFAVVDTITFASGSKQFALTNADTVFATGVGFVIPSLNGTKVYFIDRTQPLTNSGGYVTEALPTFTAAKAIEKVYEGDLKFLNDKAGTNGLNADIAAACDDNCDCIDEEYKNVWKRYTWKVSMESKFSRKLFSEAHTLAVELESYAL
ncbi:MAG: hypothetical protein HYU71_06390 [Bacteroidetes bacterium]|nr:hypothetical protein [Bacteroidota bacterium]